MMMWKTGLNISLLIVCGAASGAGGARVAIAEPTLASGRDCTGVVFHDANANGVRDGGEHGVPQVRVSNGRDVAVTDAQGRVFRLLHRAQDRQVDGEGSTLTAHPIE